MGMRGKGEKGGCNGRENEDDGRKKGNEEEKIKSTEE